VTSSAAPVSGMSGGRSAYLSELLGRPLTDGSGQSLGRLADVIVRLRGTQYPLVTGLVARVGRREIFVPAGQVAGFAGEAVEFASARVDLRRFERREGEVLLHADVLGYRLIDVSRARLVRARDLRLSAADSGWVLDAVDTWWRRRRLPRLLGGRERRHQARDWQDFEPPIGHAATALGRGRLSRVRRLKPAQIADLLEEASGEEGTEILGRVHADPELEADVFDELDEELASRLLGARTDAEIAAVLARMGADDAADAIAELPQHRRLPVLDLLPPGQRIKVVALMGFNPSSAGGLMGIEFLAVPAAATVDSPAPTPNAAAMMRAALTFLASAGLTARRCVSCCDIGLRLSSWRQLKLPGDAFGPLPDPGPVAEVSIQAAEHQQRRPLGRLRCLGSSLPANIRCSRAWVASSSAGRSAGSLPIAWASLPEGSPTGPLENSHTGRPARAVRNRFTKSFAGSSQ